LPNLFSVRLLQAQPEWVQELNEADVGDLYTIEEHTDQSSFSASTEDYVDIDEIMQKYAEDQLSDYQNE